MFKIWTHRLIDGLSLNSHHLGVTARHYLYDQTMYFNETEDNNCVHLHEMVLVIVG